MANISRKAWDRYITVLSRLYNAASDDIKEYLRTHPIETRAQRDELIAYAYALATKYGEGSAEYAARMYEAIATISKKSIEAAIPAETATYGEVAKTINGCLKQSTNIDLIGNAVGRLVKQTGVDTVCRNAIRDGAEWAWVPSGDSCAFCMMLASNGWQRASKKALNGDHAEHIHANCDCTYAIRFDGKSNVEGYDPAYYQDMFKDAEGSTWDEKINYLRRENYAEHRDEILAQQREAEEPDAQINEGL